MRLGMADRRYSMPKERRKIGGRIYLYLEWRKPKSEAEEVAVRLRNRGKSVRLMRAKHGWAVYVR